MASNKRIGGEPSRAGARMGSRTGVWTTALLASSMLTGVAVHAQTAPSSGAVALEEVVVTAQKRSENLQDVPVSIQALGSAKLEQLQISNFTDYVKYLPSVSFQTTSPGFSNVYMRGVASGGDGNHSGPLPSVGIYLDEQPITTIQGALDIHVYDIARVEALAGPQGTLYGASSQAGTIRIITNKPTTAGFSAGYDVEANSVAHGDAGYVLEGFVNQPVNDKIAVRLVGWAEHQGGYIDNVAGTRTYPTSGVTVNNASQVKNDYNDVDIYGGRAALRVELGDNWVATPSIMGQKEKVGGLFSYDPSLGDLKVAHYYPETSDDKWWQAAMTLEGQISNLDVVYAGSYLKRTVDTQQDYTDYSFFYDTLTTYGAYWTDDAGNPVNPAQYIQGKDRYAKVSHEIRVSTPQENRLRFVGGVFYQRQTHGITQDYIIDAIGESISVPGYPHTIWLTKQKRVDRDQAAFGELAYDITDKLTVTGGLSYLNDRKRVVSDVTLRDPFSALNLQSVPQFTALGLPGNLYGALGGLQFYYGNTTNHAPVNFPNATESGELKGDKITYAVRAAYDFGWVNAYVSYSTGWKAGAYNLSSDSRPPNANGVGRTAAPEDVSVYEAGLKANFPGGYLNLAIFDQSIKGFQSNAYTGIGYSLVNAGEESVKGFEVDSAYKPTDWLALTASATYLDPKYDSFTGAACVNYDTVRCPLNVSTGLRPNFRDLTGDRPAGIPKWSLSTSATISHELGGGYAGYLRAEYDYVSKTQLSETTPPNVGTWGQNIVNASLGVTDNDHGLELTLWARNLTNDESLIATFPTVAQDGSYSGYPTPPRMYGVTLRKTF